MVQGGAGWCRVDGARWSRVVCGGGWGTNTCSKCRKDGARKKQSVGGADGCGQRLGKPHLDADSVELVVLHEVKLCYREVGGSRENVHRDHVAIAF